MGIPKVYKVAVYLNGSWRLDITFNRKWKARVFHWILNKSSWGSGVRHY